MFCKDLTTVRDVVQKLRTAVDVSILSVHRTGTSHRVHTGSGSRCYRHDRVDLRQRTYDTTDAQKQSQAGQG